MWVFFFFFLCLWFFFVGVVGFCFGFLSPLLDFGLVLPSFPLCYYGLLGRLLWSEQEGVLLCAAIGAGRYLFHGIRFSLFFPTSDQIGYCPPQGQARSLDWQ